MGYAMANAAPAAARDVSGAGKKKRANRSAKLKQCKLDARREQWLSQVKNKDSKATSMAASPTTPLPPTPLSLPRARTGQTDSGRIPVEEEREGPGFHDNSDSESPTHSPTSSSSGHASIKGRPANSMGSSCSIGSSSRTVSDTELDEEEVVDRVGEHGPLDDWEAVADALSADNDRGRRNVDSPTLSVIKPDATPASLERAPGWVSTEPEPIRPPPRVQGSPGQASTKAEPIRPPPRAWRPDDAYRPQILPSLSKQRSFTMGMERHCRSTHPCGILSSPSTCPICCEDLDVTDSTFLPCSCGFHLCLFCHKRILEEDGRCPGCRKRYGPMAGGAMDVGGGGVSFRLSRSCRMS